LLIEFNPHSFESQKTQYMRLPYLIAVLLFTVTTNAQINYQPIYDNSTFNNRDVTLRPVGSTLSAAGVSGTGAATYKIPIWCMPGTNGMQPNISLAYSSQGGNGIMGMGWSIAGLSAITRVGRDIYHDGEVAAIEYSTSDRFALDGTRLVVNPSYMYGANGSYYALETEDFSQIVSSGTKGSGPESFTVRKKDGTLFEYGNSSNSRFLTNDDNHVMMWCLNKIQDNNGNYIDFEYSFEGRSLRLEKIKYTGNIYTSTPTYNTIDFDYAARIDQNKVYEAGSYLTTQFLLEKIKIVDENSVVQKSYELTYGNDNINSYLREVTEVNKNNDKLNSIQFKYGDNVQHLQESNVNITLNSSAYLHRGDFDGDGIGEMIAFNTAVASPGNYLYNTGFSIYKKNTSTNSYYQAVPTVTFLANYEKYKKQNYIASGYSLSKTDFNGDEKYIV